MRINVVPVHMLADIHLRAEYREILMSPYYYKRSMNTLNGINYTKIPSGYTLNTGHGYMWYNKMGYIVRRHYELEQEMIVRGFKIRDVYSLNTSFVNENDFGDYIPNKVDMRINIVRILIRIQQMYFEKNKPYFYKYYGESKPYEFWIDLYDKLLNERN